MEILNNTSEFGTGKRRWILYTIILLVCGLYVGRLVQLQIIEGEEYRSKSDMQAIKQIVKEPVRGNVFDRNGRGVIHNTPSLSITITPSEFDIRTLDFLATVLNTNEDELREKVERYRRISPTQPVKVFRDADPKVLAAIEENRNELAGVAVVAESKRVYDFKGNSPHLFGYTKEIAEQQLTQLGDYYRPGDVIGHSGIESSYENFLRGRKGIEFAAVNVLGQRVSSFNDGHNDIGAEDGFDLKLGIDVRLQDYVDSLIDRKGAAVAVEPKTGEILALVSKPDYDLRKFSGRTPRAMYDSIANDPETPMFNRATQTTYPPGSTWKMLMALAALQEGIITENSTLPCRGIFAYRNKVWKCHGAHGATDVRRAIQVSCNSFFYQLGLKLGVRRFEKYSKMFGFGSKLSSDIIDEGMGILPTEQYMNRRYGKNGWGDGVLVNWGIGQGEVGVTPLQMATYAAALANRGVWNQPHVVRSIMDKLTGKEQAAGYASQQIPINAEYFDIIHDGMDAVVNRAGGTAGVAQLNGIRVCGKTGTAQNSQNKDHAWFICFAPRENPQIALCVMIENAGASGGTIAAPLAQKILQRYFDLLREDRDKKFPKTAPVDSLTTAKPREIAQSK
jgi:penicillin-binding protein 2